MRRKEKQETQNNAAKEKGARKLKPRARFADFLAFLALAASALLLAAGPLFKFFLSAEEGAATMRTLSVIAQYCLLAAIALPAWYFVRNKRSGWKIVYFIVLAIYVAGTVLGLTLGK